MAMEWQVFCKDTLTSEVVSGCLASGRDSTYLEWMFKAWGWTVGVSLTALVVALAVGSIIGVIRTLPDSPWLTRFGNAWVELFRNIPLLVQIFLWYFVLPALIPPLKSLPPFVLVVLALGFFTSARIAEQVRAGIQALPKGDAKLQKAINDSIARQIKDGSLAKLYDKWFLQPIPPNNVSLNMPASESTKAAWANPNNKPMEDYAK